MKWQVWITGYPGSASTVDAMDAASAMRLGVLEQRACHTGETYEINASARYEGGTKLFRKLARIDSSGRITS